MLDGLTKKWWFWWFIAGVIIRLILMPITFHPDLWVFVSSGYIFASKGVFNIYDYIVNLPKDSIFISSIDFSVNSVVLLCAIILVKVKPAQQA